MLGHGLASLGVARATDDAASIATAIQRAASDPHGTERTIVAEADRVISFTRSQFVGKSTTQIGAIVAGEIMRQLAASDSSALTIPDLAPASQAPTAASGGSAVSPRVAL